MTKRSKPNLHSNTIDVIEYDYIAINAEGFDGKLILRIMSEWKGQIINKGETSCFLLIRIQNTRHTIQIFSNLLEYINYRIVHSKFHIETQSSYGTEYSSATWDDKSVYVSTLIKLVNHQR